MNELTYQDVLRILALVDASDRTSFEYEDKGMHIKLERHANGQPVPSRPAPAPAPTQPVPAARATAPDAEAPKPAASRAEFPDATAVEAPMTGVFYATPEPGKPPFVEVGSTVRKGDQLGIIEVMKLFTPITAPCDGVVVSILVDNQETVAKDDALMLLEAR